MTPVPRPEPQAFDAYSASYDEAVNSSVAFSGLKVDFFTRVKAAYIRDAIGATFPNSGDVDVLDVGCGVGNYHPHLAGLARSIHGVDVSPTCVATAAERNPSVAYSVYDGERLPYKDARFDVAYTICVMHHVPPDRWPAFAQEMRRVLKPGGPALVFEHNPFNPLTRRAVSSCAFDHDAVLLRARVTEHLLSEAGLERVASRYILSVPAASRAMRRVDRLFGRLPFGAQ